MRVDAGRPQLELWMHRIGGPSEGPEAIEQLLRPQTAGSSRQKQGISSYHIISSRLVIEIIVISSMVIEVVVT